MNIPTDDSLVEESFLDKMITKRAAKQYIYSRTIIFNFMEEPKPLKRHPALVPLSKDHHFGLLLCWKIRMGIKKGIDPLRIVQYVEYFFKDHLKQHFLEEEQYVFVALDENDEKRIKAEDQHRELKQLVERMLKKPFESTDILIEFEKVLEQHIRFEERDLFPYIQDQLNEEDLKELKAKIEEIHVVQRDEWIDTFWETAK